MMDVNIVIVVESSENNKKKILRHTYYISKIININVRDYTTTIFHIGDRDQIGRARSKLINQLTYVDTTLPQISCVSINVV